MSSAEDLVQQLVSALQACEELAESNEEACQLRSRAALLTSAIRRNLLHLVSPAFARFLSTGSRRSCRNRDEGRSARLAAQRFALSLIFHS